MVARGTGLQLKVTLEVTRIVGVDPGPEPGVYLLTVVDGGIVASGEISLSADSLLEGLRAIAGVPYWAVERYTIRPNTGRMAGQAVQTRTVAQAEAVRDTVTYLPGTRVVQFIGPSQVKPWATDARLKEFGIKASSRHHRDAARHALYMGVTLGKVAWPVEQT